MTKRILITTGIFPPDIGGPSSYARMISADLVKHDTKVTVITYSSTYSSVLDVGLPVKVHRVWARIPWGVRHLIFFFIVWWHARRADVIFSLNATSAGYASAIAAYLVRKPFLVRVVGDYAWEIAIQTGQTPLLIGDFQQSAKRRRIHRLDRIQKWVCRRALYVIVPSHYLADLIMKWGIYSEKIKIIYNSVDILPAAYSKEEARRKIGVAGNIILSVGRLVPWKGFRMLIKIMPQLLAENQFTRLVIVGDGPDMKALSTMVRNLGLERKVFLIGKKQSKELSVYFAAADMFVLNTGYEGFSHQILEAMACGTPVISTAVGGNPEIIHQGENGLMVKYNDEYNLIEAIKTVFQMPDLRERFIHEGKKTAMQFSQDRMFKGLNKLIF